MWSNRVSGCGMITPGCLLALCVKAKLWLSQKWSSACNSLICAKWWLLMYYILIFSSDSDLMGDILDFTISRNKFMAKSTRAVRWSCTGISHPLQYVASSLEVPVFADPLTPQGEEMCSFPYVCPMHGFSIDCTAREQFDSHPLGVAAALKQMVCILCSPQTSKFSVLLGSS